MKNRIPNRNFFIVANEVNDEEVETFLLNKNETTQDLFCKVTTMYKVLAKSLWHSKIWK